MGNQKLVSIIIPAYNVENYIDECLESILAQTYSNWEAIVVDDGSKDSTWDHILKIASRDSRFRTYRRDNSGVSATRNFALLEAKGEYIQFVDSDDYIAPEAVETLVHTMEQNAADWVAFQYHRVDEKGQPLEDFEFMEGMVDISTNDKKAELIINPLLDYKIGYEACFKLFKVSIIKKYHIRFLEDCHIGEDLEFNLCYSLYADNILCVKDRLYYYRIRSTSAMGQSGDLDRAFKERLKLVQGFYPVFSQVMGVDSDRYFYPIFYKLMISSSRGYTAKDALQVAKKYGGEFYKKWLSEAMMHKADFKSFYSPEKENLLYHFGLYIHTYLVNNPLGKLYLKVYNIYRLIRRRPAIEKWRMP